MPSRPPACSRPARGPAAPAVPLLLALALLAPSCAFVSPRFSQDVQASFARDEMRKLTTPSLELYYPAHRKAEAERMAGRLEQCVAKLRANALDKRERPRVLAFMTSTDFNNAYVQPDVVSTPQQMVLPQHMRLELFNLFGLGVSEIGDVACHEAVHYVQMEQVRGFWHALNRFTGGLLQPNIFTETWFLEGLATYYEGRLGLSVGRPHSPIWNGWYTAALQEEGTPDFGFVSPQNRRMLPFGGNYLAGSKFVAWLAERHGERKLWHLVDVQGDSIASFVGLSRRFKRAYGKDLGDLYADFAKEEAARLPRRARPEGQRVLDDDAGYFARLAGSPADGAIATVSVGHEEVAALTVYERDGRVRLRRELQRYLPTRPYVSTSPVAMSGLSFTGDGRSLFLVAADVGSQGSDIYRLWQLDARTGDLVRTWEGLDGMGGSVTPQGDAYVYVQVNGDVSNLVRLDLASGQRTPLTAFTGRASLGAPAVSPDGKRIAFARWSGEGFDLALREEDGRVRALTTDGRFNYQPRWADAQHVAFLREEDGRGQAHLLNVDTGARVAVTDAPHLAFDAAPLGDGQLAFLNREGARFTLDAVDVPLALAGPATAAAPQGAGDAAPQAADAQGLAALPPSPTAQVLKDEPYRPFERFFKPELHFPWVLALPRDSSDDGEDKIDSALVIGGVSLAGQDRLGFHQYALNLLWQSDLPAPSASLTYGNATAAPWYWSTTVAYDRLDDERNLSAGLVLSRSFWTVPVAVGARALQTDLDLLGPDEEAPRDGRLETRLRVLGPEAAVSWSSAQGTPYGGTQLGWAFGASGGYYPLARAQQTSWEGRAERDAPFGDVRLEAAGFLGGLPFTGRDNLTLSALARRLPGAPANLLSVGGTGAGLGWMSHSDRGVGREPLFLPSGIGFGEGLRGYEDLEVRGREVLRAGARYRYRLPIEHGWATLLWFLPSFYVDQLELDGFGEYARVDRRTNLRAVGGGLQLRTTVGQASPFTLYYQYARRFDFGRGDLHLVGLGF